MADPTAGYHPRAVLLVHVFSGPLRRATIGGLVAGIVAGAIAGIGIGDRVPWPIGIAIVAIVTAAFGVAIAVLLVPTKPRRAFEAFSWLGHREVVRFRERTGSRTPSSFAECRVWLEANPPSPAVGGARVEILISIGAFDVARAEFAALPAPTSDLERLERAGLRAFGELVETGTFDVSALDEVVGAMPAGSDVAKEGAVVRAVAETRQRLAREEPEPLGPLLAVRKMLGREPALVVLGDTWRPFAVSLLSFGFLSGVILALVSILG